MFITIILFALILGLLIFVHELGHFITARRNGVTAHEFGFGFPPRVIGVVQDPQTNKWRIVFGSQEYYGEKTLYSINLIPLGGFVRIKGENPVSPDDIANMDKMSEVDKEYVRMSLDKDSFAVQSKWVRCKILAAGVMMNFVLAWVLIIIVLMIGAPEPKDEHVDPSRIIRTIGVQVTAIESGSPAEDMGIKIGDNVREVCAQGACVTITEADQLRETILAHKGQEIEMRILRGKEEVVVNGVPRTEIKEDQGALGISMMETVIVRYPWYEALWEGLMRVFNMIVMIVVAFGQMIFTLVTGGQVTAEVAGPVGIAMMTQQMRDLGFIYVIQFAAILSVNLGIINILPIPALDGGRIIFLAIEAIMRKPVNQKIEGILHSTFFIALLGLMALITIRDVLKFF